MARQNCVTTIEKDDEGLEELVIRVPLDRDMWYKNIQNSNREKNSVTLVNGDLVAEAGRRGAVDFYLDLGPHHLQLRGGVNIYVSRPSSEGKAAKISAAEAAELARAEAEENAKYTILDRPLLNQQGEVFRKQGERILKDTLAELFLGGFTFMQ